MARRWAAEKRDQQLLVRITARQREVLESVAHLARVSPPEYVHQLLVGHLAARANDPFVVRDLENRAAFAAQDGKVRHIGSGAAGEQRAPS
jgi:hypothetical protein